MTFYSRQRCVNLTSAWKSAQGERENNDTVRISRCLYSPVWDWDNWAAGMWPFCYWGGHGNSWWWHWLMCLYAAFNQMCFRIRFIDKRLARGPVHQAETLNICRWKKMEFSLWPLLNLFQWKLHRTETVWKTRIKQCLFRGPGHQISPGQRDYSGFVRLLSSHGCTPADGNVRKDLAYILKGSW